MITNLIYWLAYAKIAFLRRSPCGFALAQPSISGMDAWRKALLTGNFLQQGSQAAAFIAVKRGKKRILVLTSNLAYLFQDFDAIIC